MSGKRTVDTGRRRLSALLTGAIVMPLASGLGLAGGVANLVLAPVTAQAYAGKDNVVDLNANLVAGPSTGYPYQVGGRTYAVSAAPVNGTNPRLVLAASENGGLWQGTVDQTGTVFSRWAHVDSFTPKFLKDVKIIPSEPNVAIVTARWDSHKTTQQGVWRGVLSGSVWKWTQATSCLDANAIDVLAGSPGTSHIYVTDDCGLEVSTDSGQSFSVSSPSVTNVNDPKHLYNVKAETIPAGGDPTTTEIPQHDLVSVCGAAGFFRWTSWTYPNGTPAWSAQDLNSPLKIGAALPNLVSGNPDPRTVNMPCGIDFAPGDDTTILVATQSSGSAANLPQNGTQLFESDSSGAPGSWKNLKPTEDWNGGGLPWVVTTPSVGNPDPNAFDAYLGTTTEVLVGSCSSVSVPRCGGGNGQNGGSWAPFDVPGRAAGTLHEDPSALYFDDPSDSNYHGCPWLEVGDGGIFRDTQTGSGCSDTPASQWAAQSLGLRAWEVNKVAGTDVPATSTVAAHTDLYAGLQDDGLLMSTNSGGQWESVDNADIWGLWADPQGPGSHVLYHWCCGDTIKLANETFSSAPTVWSTAPPLPPGFDLKTFYPTQIGKGSYAIVMPTGTPPGQTLTLFVTTDSGQHWNPVGPKSLPFTGTVNTLLFSTAGGKDVFYVVVRVLENANTPTPGPYANLLYRISGPLDSTATVAFVGGLPDPNFTLLAVNPFDPNRLYVLDSGTVKRTTTGTAVAPTWSTDSALVAAVQTEGVSGGPQLFDFGGQLTSITYDSCSATTTTCAAGRTSAIVAGTVDAGVYVSLDDGTTWKYMRGSDRLAYVKSAFFDTRNTDIFVSSYGRGVWRVDAPPQSTITIGSPKLAGSPPVVNPSTKFTVSAIGRRPVASVFFRASSETGWSKATGATGTFQIQGLPLCLPTGCVTTQPLDGQYTVQYYAVDTAGNEETPQSLTVKMVATPPAVSLQVGSPEDTTTTPPTVRASATAPTPLFLTANTLLPDTVAGISYREYKKGAAAPGFTALTVPAGYTGAPISIPSLTGANGTIWNIDYFTVDAFGAKVSGTQQLQVNSKVKLTAFCSGSFDMRSGQQFDTGLCAPATSGDLAWNPSQIMTPGGLSGVQMALVGSVSFSGVTESQLESQTYTTQMSVQPQANQVYGVYGHDGHYAKLLINTVGSNLDFTYLTYPDVAPAPSPPPLCSGTGSATPGTQGAYIDLECGKGTNNPGMNVNPYDIAADGGTSLSGTLNPAVLNSIYDWTSLDYLGQLSFAGVTEAQVKAGTEYNRAEFAVPGNVFGVYTRDGYYAKLIVNSVSSTDDTIGFSYVTYADQSFPSPTMTWCMSGSAGITSTMSIDFDNPSCPMPSQGDVQWNGSQLSPGTLTAPDSQSSALNQYPATDTIALVGNVNFDSLTLAQLEGLQYGSSPLGSLSAGEVVAVHTRGGFFVKLLINAVGGALDFSYVDYRAEMCEVDAGPGGTTAPGPAYLTDGLQWDAEARCANTPLPNDTGDFSWTQATNLLVPVAGAGLAVMPAGTQIDQVTLSQLRAQTYSTGSINLNQDAGLVLALRTRHGHYAKMIVLPNSCCGSPEVGITEYTFQ